MADIGTRYTDEQREELERRIHEIYQDAEKDITNKLNEHMRKFAIKDQIYQEKLQRGEITPAYYARWKSGQVFIGKMWKQKKADIHETAMNAGKASMDIINRKSIGVFTHNMNVQSYLLEKQFGATVGLNLYDVHTVSRMLRDNPKMLPEWKIDEPKQYIWDEKRVQTAITQGIIQGESLDKIAKRIAVGLCGSDEKRMKLFAQTAMTGAQNAGRVESIREANEMGLETEKGWDATLDKRTRETHRILDGQFVAEDEDFTVNGMHIKYPGDPDAPPQLVYNCRCALVGRVKRYASGANYKRRDNTTGKNMEYKTYKQWATEKGFWKEPKWNVAAKTNKEGYTYGEKILFPVFSDKDGKLQEYSFTVTKQADYGFPNGTPNGVHETRSADIYTLDDGTRFICPSDLDENKQTTPTYFIERYLQVPLEYRRKIQKTIHILDYRNPQDEFFEKKYNQPGFKSYATGGKEISFYASTYHDDKYVVYTYYHEGAHYIDLFADDALAMSHSDEWKDAKIKDKEYPTEYAKVADVEDFAESVACYYTKADFKTKFKNRAKILKRVLGNGKNKRKNP